MRVRYHGPFVDGVRLEVPGSREVLVAHGEEIEVSDFLGRSLIEQPDNWEQVADKAPPAPATKTAGKAEKKED